MIRDDCAKVGVLMLPVVADIEPKQKTVEIYRLGQSVEILINPKTLSGESVLPGFVLDLEPIWS